MDEFLRQLKETVEDWLDPQHRDTPQMRSSPLWMKYKAENETRKACGKKLLKMVEHFEKLHSDAYHRILFVKNNE